MTKTELECAAAPADVAREPAELTEGELSHVAGGALPPVRGPKQPPETDLIGLL